MKRRQEAAEAAEREKREREAAEAAAAAAAAQDALDRADTPHEQPAANGNRPPVLYRAARPRAVTHSVINSVISQWSE